MAIHECFGSYATSSAIRNRTTHMKVLKGFIKEISKLLRNSLSEISFISDAVLPQLQVEHETATSFGFTGQYGQDYVLSKLLFLLPSENKYTYVDIGAHDGYQFSNSRFLDLNPDWSGFCIEANPNIFPRLVKNRPLAVNLNQAISSKIEKVNFQMNSGYSEMLSGIVKNYGLRHKLRIKRDIAEHLDQAQILNLESTTLEAVLDEYRVKKVDILFIDIEGSELSVLSAFDFSKFRVNMILVERNYSSKGVLQLLARNNFRRIMALGSDDLYIQRDLLQ